MDMSDQLNVEIRLTKSEMQSIIGGASLSGTIVNAFNSAFKTIYGFGQNFGTAVRRIAKRKLCKL